MAKKATTDGVVADKDFLREIPSLEFSGRKCPSVALYLNSTGRMRNPDIPNVLIHGCEKGNGKIQKLKAERTPYTFGVCKYCGCTIDRWYLMSPKKERVLDGYKPLPDTLKNKEFIIVSSHPVVENAYIIRRCEGVFTNAFDDAKKTWEIEQKSKVISALEIIPGVSIKGYKVLVKSIKEINPFEAMNINSQTINSDWTRQIIYEDSVDLIDFLRKNPIFTERTGIRHTLMNLPSDFGYLKPEPYMIFHLCLVAEFPVLELLVKSGYSKLYFDILREFLRASSKEAMKVKTKRLYDLFTFSTKGSEALRIPSYIGDYLKVKSAPIEEYLNWCDIYEIQNITKEQFNKFVNSTEFLLLNLESNSYGILPNIIKYGYSIEQVIKYVYKQYLLKKKVGNTNIRFSTLLGSMRDYLTMCEFNNIEPNKFPSDIVQAHDEVASVVRETKKDLSKMESLGESTQKLLDSFIDENKLTKMEQKFIIKVPTSEADFISEGIQQNSCVGHYAKLVNTGERIVFFIRKKDEPEKSFITAEYVTDTGELGQCMYANNRVVEDETIKNYCNVACNRIRTGLLTSKIK